MSASVQLVLPNTQSSTGTAATGIAGFIAGRLSSGGCSTGKAGGVFFWISTSGTWTITSDLSTFIHAKGGSPVS